MSVHPALLDRDRAVVIVIDLQETFLRVIHAREQLLSNVSLLLQAAEILGVPIIATTQYAARLGGVANELLSLLPSAIDKMAFSAAREAAFEEALSASGRRQVVLCGVETHICVTQTALDLVNQGYQAHVTADGVSSRTLEKHKLGMERLRDNSVFPIATEAAVYEMLGQAGTPEFRRILPLVK